MPEEIEKEENIIKKVCREYDITIKELADEIGYVYGSLLNMSSKKNEDISIMLKKVLELFVKNKELEKEVEELYLIKKWIRSVSVQ